MDKMTATMLHFPQLYTYFRSSSSDDSKTTYWNSRSNGLTNDAMENLVRQIVQDEAEERNGNGNGPGVEVRQHATRVLTQSGRNVNPHAVTASKDDFALSKPIGFQRIVPCTSHKPRTHTEKKELREAMICNFCKKDPDLRKNCLTHRLKDPFTKVLTCPQLRRYICKLCGGTGDSAHTQKYCPMNQFKLIGK